MVFIAGALFLMDSAFRRERSTCAGELGAAVPGRLAGRRDAHRTSAQRDGKFVEGVLVHGSGLTLGPVDIPGIDAIILQNCLFAFVRG